MFSRVECRDAIHLCTQHNREKRKKNMKEIEHVFCIRFCKIPRRIVLSLLVAWGLQRGWKKRERKWSGFDCMCVYRYFRKPFPWPSLFQGWTGREGRHRSVVTGSPRGSRYIPVPKSARFALVLSPSDIRLLEALGPPIPLVDLDSSSGNISLFPSLLLLTLNIFSFLTPNPPYPFSLSPSLST